MSNLSQIRRAEMLEYLHHLKEIHTDDESRIALGKIETALTEKKYGLVWEEHEEEVDKQLVHNIPVFKEIEDKKIVRDNTTDFNFLLEGDNLHSLKLLDKTHKGNIDVIYIDPPYNTKNKEFVYDDNRVGLDDGFRHSKWLSFMGKRLDYAKNLLSDDGIIFINIDENEVHQLKILGDEIFGEDNFLGEFIWKARSGKGGTTALISIEHESILCYAKNKPEANFYMEIRVSDTEFFMEEVLIDDNMVFDIDNLKGFLNDTSSFGFIAKENNKIIGFAYCYTLLRPDGKTMFYLHSIGMLPNYQDKGYGSKLLSFIKEYSKEIGCSEMFLITDKGNPRACHVYEKLGGKNDYKDEIVYVYDYEKGDK